MLDAAMFEEMVVPSRANSPKAGIVDSYMQLVRRSLAPRASNDHSPRNRERGVEYINMVESVSEFL